ncbi:MAG: hypothetical protein OEM61_11490, partial [Desulfobacteraceae bacterium]|nr:hypothetical protein [Desulfobacteraceae bacterium]
MYPAEFLDEAYAYAGAVDTSLTANAAGISAGDGINVIENYNSINVVSEVDAGSSAQANTTGDSVTYSESYAGGKAGAIGIVAGGGQNTITNFKDGNITVKAKADGHAYAYADEVAHAYVGSGGKPGVIAEAIGISAGDGINTIINCGTLEVTAEAIAKAEESIGGDKGFSYAKAYATATGIRTGDGDDIIINCGRIVTTTIKKENSSEVTSSGTAISSGAGNDQVFLLDASESDGQINLGDGDDWLTFWGNPLVTGDVTGAVGTDALVFEGAGSIDFTPVAFENAIKQGPGTYSVPSLPTMQRIEVNQDTLQINSNYTMANDSNFQATVNGDGTNGLLKVEGTAQLAGDLRVIKGPGPYINGTTYDIIQADVLNGVFGSETLPEAKPLLSFQTHTYSDRLEVEALAKSFTTVAANSLQRTIAQHLDNIIPKATGDLSLVLGDFQVLSESDFNEAFASLSPDSYDISTRITFDIARLYVESLHQRMHSLRANLTSPSTVTQAKS